MTPIAWSLVWFGVLALLFVGAFIWCAREDRRAWERMRELVAQERRASPRCGPTSAGGVCSPSAPPAPPSPGARRARPTAGTRRHVRRRVHG